MSTTLTKPSKLAGATVHSEPIAQDWPAVLKFAAIGVQLVLLYILVMRYNLESPAFVQLTGVTFAGFAVNHLLPRAWRLPFFLALSLSGIVLVLGWQQAAWLIGVGLALIIMCHLPAPFWARLTLILATASVMAAMRLEKIPYPWPFAIWPLIGSMFVFRMMLYLQDLYHGRKPKSLSESLSYFFLLPNVCFPLFPIIDHQAFVRTYYNDDSYRIYQVGVRWIFRGVIHLILYRIIYKNWSIGIYDVENLGDFVHYCIWLFLLYLRVSGQFHVIAGMLHLFGFNLPETHHLYYLATSFTDVWRRINIYFKDFMMRLIFYPSYFRFRELGPKSSVVAATLCVFFMTWLFHAVQWFWLRGSTLLLPQDMLFYVFLGGFVVIASLREMAHGQKHMGGTSWSTAFAYGLKALGVFTVMCLLWSMWTSKSLTEWLSLWRLVTVPPTANGWCLIVGTMIAVVGGATLTTRNPAGFEWSRFPFLSELAVRCAFMILLAGISISAVNQRMGAVGRWIASAKEAGLNDVEMAELERGYYEDLMDVDRLNGELWRLYIKQPPEWGEDLTKTGMTEPTGDLTFYKFKPSMEYFFKGAPIRTNRWGMHDKEYELKPPTVSFRIAVLGASYVMATGVDRDHTFHAVLEQRLNNEKRGTSSTYELLNFAVAGYWPLGQVTVLRDRVLPFKPNAIFLVGHAGDEKRAAYNITFALRGKVPIPAGYLGDMVKNLGINEGTPETIIRRRLAPHASELLAWSYRTIVGICKENGIRPVYMQLPQVGYPVDASAQLRMAEEAGFTTLDLAGAYGNHSMKSLQIAEWDTHPNDEGHRLIADKLYQKLMEKDVLGLTKKGM